MGFKQTEKPAESSSFSEYFTIFGNLIIFDAAIFVDRMLSSD